MKKVRVLGSTAFVLGVCQEMLDLAIDPRFRVSQATIQFDEVKDTARFSVQVVFLVRNRKRLIFTGPKQVKLFTSFTIWGDEYGDLASKQNHGDWSIVSGAPIKILSLGRYANNESRDFCLEGNSLKLVGKPIDMSAHYLS